MDLWGIHRGNLCSACLAITLIFGASALNALSTNAVFNILFCLMLIVFAASFFVAFELTLPAKWSTAVDSKAEATSDNVNEIGRAHV